MEDKNKNLKSGIITELYPNTITNKGKLTNSYYIIRYIFIQ